MRAVARTLVLWILAGAVLVAADFWHIKDFRTWSDKEVESMLTDSPWSRQVAVVFLETAGCGGGASLGRPDVRDGIHPGDEGGVRDNLVYECSPGEPEPSGRGRVDGDVEGVLESLRSRAHRAKRFSATSERMILTVSWLSALPVKRALVRGQVGADARIPVEQQQFLAQLEPLYVVSVRGFPLQFARFAQHRDALMAETILKRENKGPISPEDVEVFVENGETVIIEYVFSRDEAITLDDKEVEFIAKLGQVEVKRTFNLEDMVFVDRLSL